MLSEFRPDFTLTRNCSSDGMPLKDAFRRSKLSSEPGDIEHHQESRSETLKEGLVQAMFRNASLEICSIALSTDVYMQLFAESLR